MAAAAGDTVPQSNYRIITKKKTRANLIKCHPPVVADGLSLELAVAPAGNHNSNLRTGNSHRNKGHCSRLDNPRTRNSRNHNL